MNRGPVRSKSARVSRSSGSKSGTGTQGGLFAGYAAGLRLGCTGRVQPVREEQRQYRRPGLRRRCEGLRDRRDYAATRAHGQLWDRFCSGSSPQTAPSIRLRLHHPALLHSVHRRGGKERMGLPAVCMPRFVRRPAVLCGRHSLPEQPDAWANCGGDAPDGRQGRRGDL